LPLKTADTQAQDQQLMTLIQRATTGDQSAFATLYETTSKIVFGLVLRIVTERATAEEVLLDVYTQAWRQAGNYDSSRGSPLAWLMTIARSRAIDRLRSNRQDQHNEAIDDANGLVASSISPEEASVMSERQRLVRTALDALVPEQREVLELAYYGGLSHTEIAEKTGHPLGTVKTRTRLGMMKLREMLSPILSEQI
jgi:RNA polymerase sigma-70 factor (ECF subfamily)